MCASIREYGFKIPVLARSDGTVVDGHLRIKAARKLGSWPSGDITGIPVILCDEWTESQVKAFRILVNRSATWAQFDEELLSLELQELDAAEFDLGLSGFDDEELARLLEARDATPGLNDEDSVPDAPEATVTRAGELWLLAMPDGAGGTHRVMAGDATDRAQVERLMNGDKASLCFSDPPYGCNLAATQNIPSRHRDDGAWIANDDLDLDSLVRFLRQSFGNMLAATRPGAVWYITAPHGPIGLAFSITLHEIGVWRHSLVWVKDSLVMGRMDYHYRHEPLYFGWTPGAAHHPVPTRDQDTVWEIPRPKASPEHPCMKPVALMEKAILNSSDPNQIVLDLFGGAGATLIAAAMHRRRGFLMELEPRYVDVICQRYRDHFGCEAVLEGDGRGFDEVARERRQDASESSMAKRRPPS